MKSRKNLIVVGVLILLVLVTAIQSVQLISMKSDIKELRASGRPAVSSSSTTPLSSSSSGGAPTNLQNLPGMVGGC